MASSTSGPKAGLEDVPPGEAAQIDNIADLTVRQLKRRYKDKPRVLRGVHPKDHGCVEATFTVSETLPPEYRVGVLKKPGAQFRAAIRFSNAAPLVLPDSLDPQKDGTFVRAHGSRGMAVKLYDVGGERLVPDDGERTQDFLMINQSVFAFANVEDYEALSLAIVDDDSRARAFFERPGLSPKALRRMQVTGGIIQGIKSLTPPIPPFQAPPLSPLDNSYFSAAPFLFGEGRAMKFSAKPVNPVSRELDDAIINEPNYLRNALGERMAAADGKDICFDFQIQLATPAQLAKADELAGESGAHMENMCTLWDEKTFPFVTVARITIPPQDVSSPERMEFCETLFYTPWHGLADHQPLGGINRMRKKVYEVSANERNCPVSPELPPVKRKGPPLGTASGQATPAGSLGGAKGSLGPRRKP